MKKLLFTGAFLLAAVAAFNVVANDTIETEKFIEEASAKGLAEIETARMALKKSDSTGVKQFAQKMIDEHTAANKELATIARNKNLETADDVELMNKAKALILRQRDGESFDVAYANNQVSAHEQTVELFKKASRSKDREIKSYAEKMLPKLEGHLRMARDLVVTTKAAETNDQADHGQMNTNRDSTTPNRTVPEDARSNTTGDTTRDKTDGPDTRTGVGTVPPTQYSE